MKACRRLQHLHFHGAISVFHVVRLAALGARRWGHFRFLWRNIEMTAQRPTPFNLVARAGREGEGGELVWGRTEGEVRAELSRRVSATLGFPWEPLLSS